MLPRESGVLIVTSVVRSTGLPQVMDLTLSTDRVDDNDVAVRVSLDVLATSLKHPRAIRLAVEPFSRFDEGLALILLTGIDEKFEPEQD